MPPQTDPPRGGSALTRNVNGAVVQLTLKEDERFIIWMRTSTFANFRKLWGRIDDRALKAGEKVRV